MDEVEIYKKKFKLDLDNVRISDEEIVERHILFGMPYIFRNNEDKYYKLKKSISAEFGISISNIVMVGSAKLGFSLAPKKLWKSMHDESDIDMVIINEKLFDEFWKDLLEFNINLIDRNEIEDKQYRQFLEYFFKGWLRPDMFPFKYLRKRKWFEFFRTISYKEYDKRKISGAIFRNEYFFKTYHVNNIKRLRMGGNINE